MDQVEAKENKLSSQFQNRLVGIIVLVALGVIFLPDILDGKKQLQEEQFAEIPLRPAQVNELSAPEEIASVDLSEAKAQFESQKAQSEVVNSNDESAKTAESIAKKQADANSTPQSESKSQAQPESKPESKPATPTAAAYTLQLGSFKNAANVNALVKRLRKEGFRAYTLPQTPVDGELTKVYVGPDVSMAKLEKLQKQLDKSTGLKSAVVSYNPVE
ncbi:cell division protein DedD [Shewanella sp. AS1]|uniref:cell division protein DedD n=1 Tax=Shewanella sp. AS1 TaxID=2907626 RepID=UPI001F444101|nr:cell division protein DedD [Shewanella sp. AS1]MCE9678684.1 cell division protein DedD [Shewanella sp. AS1]